MTSSGPAPPANRRSLDDRLRNQFNEADPDRHNTTEHRMKLTVAVVVVGQILNPAAVKGGARIVLESGLGNTRFTRDMDVVAESQDVDGFLDGLAERLREGWGGFTGRVVPDNQATPTGVPERYIMQPARIQLDYLGSHWFTIRLELSRDEVGSIVNTTNVLSKDISDLFARLGLPRPNPVTAISIEHQMAQKLHACSSGVQEENARAHDLVDLQILDKYRPDLASVRDIVTRLFPFRKGVAWPPKVAGNSDWPQLYEAAADGIDVLPDVASAVEWVNNLIERIDESVT